MRCYEALSQLESNEIATKASAMTQLAFEDNEEVWYISETNPFSNLYSSPCYCHICSSLSTVTVTFTSNGFRTSKRIYSAYDILQHLQAPEWTDADACSRCQSGFTTFNRKHHCRNCGRVFDSLCCHKQLALPHWGYRDPVRVCEGCYNLILREGTKAAPPSAIRMPAPKQKAQSKAQDAADADHLKAIQLSLAESGHQPTGPAVNANRPDPPKDEEDDDDMKAAIEASLKDMRSAPPPNHVNQPVHAFPTRSSSQQYVQQNAHQSRVSRANRAQRF